MIFMPTTGILMGYFGGKGLPFFFTTIPGAKAEDQNKNVAKWSWKTHKWAGTAFECLVAAHVAGATLHVLKGDKIFSRISPFAGVAVVSYMDEEDEDGDDLFI